MATARKALAARFGLAYGVEMQDWEWEVAHPSLLPHLLAAYQGGDLSEDERFSLMEIMVQAVADIESPADAVPREWEAVAELLRTSPRLHASTIAYWSAMSGAEGWAWPGVIRAMRELSSQVEPQLAEPGAGANPPVEGSSRP
jgi:hypothetical protein